MLWGSTLLGTPLELLKVSLCGVLHTFAIEKLSLQQCITVGQKQVSLNRKVSTILRVFNCCFTCICTCTIVAMRTSMEVLEFLRKQYN